MAEAKPKPVLLVGVDVPFFAAVGLILKWSLAAIPAAFLLSMIVAAAWTFAAGAVAALFALLGGGAA